MITNIRGIVEGTTAEGFTCAGCGQYYTYNVDRPDGAAIAESSKRFGSFTVQDPNDLAVVCDDCYKNPRMPWNAQLN